MFVSGYLELIAIGLGALASYGVILLYMLFVDESKTLTKKMANLFHHAEVGGVVMALGWPVYEYINIYLAEFMWGFAVFCIADDLQSHIRDYVEKKRREGTLWE